MRPIEAASVSLLAAALALTAAPPATAGPVPGLFSFQPKNVVPGGTLSVTAWRLDPGVLAVAFSITDATGHANILGLATPRNGMVQAQFTVPADAAPGRYHVGLRASNLDVIVNLVGTLRVVPAQYPVFGFRQTAAFPGSTWAVSGGSFRGSSATIGLLDRNRQPIVLASKPVVGGSFDAQITLPAGLPLGAYFPFVRDSASLFAVNATGPLTVVSSTPPQWIPTGFYPIGAAVDVASNRLFVPNGGDNTLSVFDGATGGAVTTLAIGGLPCAIASDESRHRVYVANANTDDLSVVDSTGATVVATVPVQAVAPCGVAALPALGRVYTANYGSDDMTVIDTVSNTVAAVVPVGRGPFAIAANPATGLVYVAAGFEAAVDVIDGATLQKVARVPVGTTPDAFGINPVTNRVYVANYFSDTVSVIDGTSNTVIATIATGSEPSGVAVDPGLDLVYVSNWASQTATVFDASTFTVLADILCGLTPDGAVVNEATHKAYLVNSISGNVTVLDGTTYRH